MSPIPPALSLDVVQRRRKWFAGLVLLALIVLTASVRSVAALDGEWHEGVEGFGLAAIIVAIVGRAWCSLYIGGRKKAEIVDRGPYSMTGTAARKTRPSRHSLSI